MNRSFLILITFASALMLCGLVAIVRIGTPPPSAIVQEVPKDAGNSGFLQQKDPSSPAKAAFATEAERRGNTTAPGPGGAFRTESTATTAVDATSSAPPAPASASTPDGDGHPPTPTPTPEEEIAAARMASAATGEADVDVARFAETSDSNRITTRKDDKTIDQKDSKKAEKLRAKNDRRLAQGKGPVDGATSDTPALDAFQVALGFQGTDKFSYGKVVKAVQGMEAQEFPQAAAQLQQMEWNKESHYMMNALMKQWGKTDLDSALQAADQMDIRRMQRDAKREAMEGWAAHNTDAAYNMLLGGEDGDPLAEFVSPTKVFHDLAKVNAQGALDKVWNLPDSKQQNAALAGVLAALPSDERRQATRSLYQQAPTPESQSMLARAVVNDLRIYQPAEAAAFVDTIQEADIRKSVSSTLIGTWAADDPQQAMGWAASHPPGEQTERDVSSVASRWVRTDRHEFADWLNQQPATPTLDPAVQAMVRAEQKENPGTAMGWAESIVDAKDRVSSVRSVAATWMKTDPATATPYILNHAELSDKDKDRLLR